MKNLSFLAVATLMIGNIASAVSVPGWERPIKEAELNYIAPTKPQSGLLANHLTLNQLDEATEPTTFTLQEDTGIRCITTPCPSSRNVEFKINQILHERRDGVRYVATEILKNIPPHVRIVPRTLIVKESTMELVAPGGGGFMQRTMWNVEVRRFNDETHHYYGEVQDVYTIQQAE